MTPHEFRDMMLRAKVRFGAERDLQDDVAVLLHHARVPFERECRIGPGRRRIDFLVDGGLGVECKVASGPALVMPQLIDYADSGAVSALVLLTSRASHRSLGEHTTLCGRPFLVVWVGGCRL